MPGPECGREEGCRMQEREGEGVLLGRVEAGAKVGAGEGV